MKATWHKFIGLPSPDRQLLFQAALLAGAARLGLWLLPFRVLPGVLARLAQLIAWRTSTPVAPQRIAWAVVAVCSYIPVATCLTQALAACALLAQHGCPAQLRIGVVRAAHGQLLAHAWVEVDQQVILGGSISGQYAPLLGSSPDEDDRRWTMHRRLSSIVHRRNTFTIRCTKRHQP